MKQSYFILKGFLILCFTAVLINMSYAGTKVRNGNKIVSALNSSTDYMVFYGSFDDNKVLQAKYFKLIVVDINGITPEQVDDIKKGFDNIPGTDDDVTVLGYLSIGEQDGSLIQGDGTGPVYWNGSQIVHENKGYASFYLDDIDKNGLPDKDGTWSSYYVNAGDSAWWNFNKPLAQNIIETHHCDGLFLDLVDTGSPDSWGLPYQWTSEGMINYIEYLRQNYPDKYLLANRGIFYFDPSIPFEYQYADRYRKAIDGLMIESYYSTWDWNKSIGIYNTSFPLLRDHFAPLLNTQAHKSDGFNIFILDYISSWQPDHDALLDTVVKVSERDQGWLISVSPILLDTIRFDVFNHHIIDHNPPSWSKTVGVSKYKWNADSLIIYFDEANDQTPPVHYNIYISENDIDFNSQPQYENILPLTSDKSDFKYIIPNLDSTKTYNIAVRAYDSNTPVHMDPNRKVIKTIPGIVPAIKIDGYFDDWGSYNLVDNLGPADTSLAASCDLSAVWYSEDKNNYYFSFSAHGEIQNPPYYYHVFIDEDNDRTTGYHSGGSYIGIDLMLENGYLWRYTGVNNSWSWNYLGQVDYKIDITNKDQAELAIPKSFIKGNPSSISFIYNISDPSDSAEINYAPADYKLRGYHSSDFIQETTHQPIVPADYKISCTAYPNPFNPSVIFAMNFNKPLYDNIILKIYDITGRLVSNSTIPVNGQAELHYTWNAESVNNVRLASGIYLYRVEGSKRNLITIGKIVLLK